MPIRQSGTVLTQPTGGASGSVGEGGGGGRGGRLVEGAITPPAKVVECAARSRGGRLRKTCFAEERPAHQTQQIRSGSVSSGIPRPLSHSAPCLLSLHLSRDCGLAVPHGCRLAAAFDRSGDCIGSIGYRPRHRHRRHFSPDRLSSTPHPPSGGRRHRHLIRRGLSDAGRCIQSCKCNCLGA